MYAPEILSEPNIGPPTTGVLFNAGVALKTRKSWLNQKELACIGSIFVKYGSAPAIQLE